MRTCTGMVSTRSQRAFWKHPHLLVPVALATAIVASTLGIGCESQCDDTCAGDPYVTPTDATFVATPARACLTATVTGTASDAFPDLEVRIVNGCAEAVDLDWLGDGTGCNPSCPGGDCEPCPKALAAGASRDDVVYVTTDAETFSAVLNGSDSQGAFSAELRFDLVRDTY